MTKQTQYIFNEEEIKGIRYLLEYCKHRAVKHKGTPTERYKDFIIRILREL